MSLKNLLNISRGDTLVADRYIWLKKNLPKTQNGEKLLDVGCGSGAFTIMSALRGYEAVGISWDEQNQSKGIYRAKSIGVENLCTFPIGDVRNLDELFNKQKFDYVINFENIEHIINDKKLFFDVYNVLKPGGFLLLTTPYINYNAMTKSDLGPFQIIENGGHVRRGYSKSMLKELCEISGFKIEKIEFCSGFFSQISTKVLRHFNKIFGLKLSWLLIFPFRVLSYFAEYMPTFLKGKCYTICLVAYKPRFINN